MRILGNRASISAEETRFQRGPMRLLSLIDYRQFSRLTRRFYMTSPNYAPSGGCALVGAVPGALVDPLVGSLVGALPDALVEPLVGSLPGSLVDSLVGSLPGAVPGAVVGALVGSLVGSVLGALR
jgi:hypothetical protein